MSKAHCTEDTSIRGELLTLLKTSAIVLSCAAGLAAISSVPTGTTRTLSALVISNVSIGHSPSSRHVLAQLHNGNKVHVRFRRAAPPAKGQAIQIIEHGSVLHDSHSYSYVKPEGS